MISHIQSNVNLPSTTALPTNSRRLNATITPKKPKYSLLSTVRKENGKCGVCQFLNVGKNAGVFLAQSKYASPNFFRRNSSSVNIILS